MKNRDLFTHPVVAARRATRHRLAGNDEAGFTLIEVLIVVVILPIVLGGIAAALLSVFGLQDQTQNRIGDSNDELVGSANFNKDVQSAVELTTASTPGCGSAGQTQLLGLEWGTNSAATGGYDTVVSYVKVPLTVQGATTYSLVRQLCTFGQSTNPTSTSTISHDIPSTFGTNPGDVTIDPAAVQTAAAGGWTPALGVTGITFKLTEPGSGYHYSLVGLPGESTSTGAVSSVQSNGAPGCSFATPGTGTYATQLCFADFTKFAGDVATSTNGTPCQTMTLPIANTPDILSFCISESYAGGVVPATIPTYYSPSGDDSEAFLGNNGFYTGIPGNPALYQPGSQNGKLVTVYLTNIQVKNAVGEAATGWTLVTGDAESTDTNEWMVFTSNLHWSVLYNNGSSDPYGNSCYDTERFRQHRIPSVHGAPAADDQRCDPGRQQGRAPRRRIDLPANRRHVGSLRVEHQLNKTGTLMVAAQEPTGSSAAQTLTVTMKGAGLEAMFVGVLL